MGEREKLDCSFVYTLEGARPRSSGVSRPRCCWATSILEEAAFRSDAFSYQVS